MEPVWNNSGPAFHSFLSDGCQLLIASEEHSGFMSARPSLQIPLMTQILSHQSYEHNGECSNLTFLSCTSCMRAWHPTYLARWFFTCLVLIASIYATHLWEAGYYGWWNWAYLPDEIIEAIHGCFTGSSPLCVNCFDIHTVPFISTRSISPAISSSLLLISLWRDSSNGVRQSNSSNPH